LDGARTVKHKGEKEEEIPRRIKAVGTFPNKTNDYNYN